jgi:prepilin-type N-terminal cleavage/methylation domain-containing protein
MRTRDAFTLVEMLLVLAILVVAASLALPLADTMYAGSKTRAAADAVRAALVQARTHAMDESRPYRFAVHPGGVAFRVAPDDDAYWTGSGQGQAGEGSVPAYIYAENVPGGIRFDGGAGPPPVAMNGNTTPDPPASSIDTGQFETHAVFFSDGTADTDFRMVFRLPGARPLVLTMRGMTGVATTKFESQEPGATKP